MNAETVTAIAQLAQEADHNGELTREVTLDGQVFTYRNEATEFGRQLSQILMPPLPTPLLTSTLTGFADALKAGTYAYDPKMFFVHVEDYLTVSLKDRGVDKWGRRAAYMTATAKHPPIDAFRFDYFYNEPARFIIALQVAFLQTDELLYVIRLASSLKAGNTAQTKDDGFSQVLTVKTGEVTTAEVNVKPRIKLIPMRTFPEAAPVESEFLIRFQQSPNQAPSIALFEVDGNKWQGELMQSVKRWLAGEIDAAFPIIA